MHGRLHRRHGGRARRASSPTTTSARLRSYKGIAEGVENSNFLVHTDAGHFILTLYEKRVAAGDLPFFLGLMEHLAARGITCPQPVKNRQRRHARHASPAGRPRSSPSSTACGSAGRMPATAPRSARRWRGCIWPAPISRCGGRTRSSVDGWRPLYEQAKARGDSVRPGLCADIDKELDALAKAVAARPAAGRDPRRPVSRQRVLPRRQAVRPDRLLFRLHRHARL